MDNKYKYDIAISFLKEDEDLANDISAKFGDSLNIFIYSKKQEELAGTDGLESFRETFRNDSRLIVVLYRTGWGTTPWTRVEETAIKEKCLQSGWACLLFVCLEDNCTVPIWLPETDIRLNLCDYGIDQLVGAIKIRSQKLGSTIKKESAESRAQNMALKAAQNTEKLEQLKSNRSSQVGIELDLLKDAMSKTIASILNTNSTLGLEIEKGHQNGISVRSNLASIVIFPDSIYANDRKGIIARYFVGRLIMPSEEGKLIYVRQPEEQLEIKIELYYSHESKWHWRKSSSENKVINNHDLAGNLLEQLLDLHHRIERGDYEVDFDDCNDMDNEHDY